MVAKADVLRSKIIFHLDRNLHIALPNRNFDSGKFGRAKGDSWITRKAKAFARYEDRLIKSAIAIFIMDEADRVIARREAFDRNRPGLIGEHAEQARVFAAFTIRKTRRIGGQADEDDALGRPQTRNVNFKR